MKIKWLNKACAEVNCGLYKKNCLETPLSWIKKPTKRLCQGIQIYPDIIPTEFSSRCAETLTNQALLIDSFR